MSDLTPNDVHQPAALGRKVRKMATISSRKKRAAKLKGKRLGIGPAADAGVVSPKPKPKGLRIRADLAEGGSLHVRHMNDDADLIEFGGLIELADAAKSDGPVWIQLAKPGTFRGHPSGPFTLDGKTFDDIVRNFKATENHRVPIDFEHASEADPTDGSIPEKGAPAQGWIVDMKVQGGELLGLVEWGTLASDYIKAGQYRYFSPAIRFNSKDRVTGQPIGARMTSGALTNNPFLDGMKPLAAKDSSSLAHKPHEYMPAVRSALSMHPLATAAECSDTLDKLRDHFDAAGQDPDASHEGVKLGDYCMSLRNLTGAAPGATWDQVFDAVDDMIDAAMDRHEIETGAPDSDADMTDTDLDDGGDGDTTMSDNQKIAELTLTLRDRDADVKTLRDENESLKKWKDERQAKDLSDRVDEAFVTYKDKKSLTDADKDAMLIVLNASPEKFDKLYPRIAPEQRHLLRNLTPTAPTGADHAPATVIDVAPQSGVPAGETISQTITRLMSEDKSLSYNAATTKAAKLRA